MSGEAFPTKRQYDRLPITLEVNYNTEMEFLNSTTKNICIGGMFIHTLYPLPEGTEINVRFSIPELSMEFSSAAKVVWAATPSQGDKDGDSGMGINFLNLSEEKCKKLEEFITKKLEKKSEAVKK